MNSTAVVERPAVKVTESDHRQNVSDDADFQRIVGELKTQKLRGEEAITRAVELIHEYQAKFGNSERQLKVLADTVGVTTRTFYRWIDQVENPKPTDEKEQKPSFKTAKSPNGHDMFTLLSWLHKSIRRGHLGDQYVDDALYAAVELDLTGFPNAVWHELFAIASEDVGSVDRLAAIETQALFLNYRELKKSGRKHHPERLPLVDAALRLAITPLAVPAKRKSRMVDHAAITLYNERPKREVPDYVKDKHTAGSKMGFKEFFENESSVSIIDPDRWLEDAKRILLAKERPIPSDNAEPPSTPTPTARAAASEITLDKKPWELHQLLIKDEADDLYQKMNELPWQSGRDGAFSIHYGLSYVNSRDGGGARAGEIPEIPEFLQKLGGCISEITKTPINYIQCHKYDPKVQVQPHRDPKDMVVPMLVIGQERTFRIGGKVASSPEGKPWFRWTQNTTPVEKHYPEAECLLKHGSLLVFNGGRVIHSMFPAEQDANFNPNGFPYRISIIFRYTTLAMREFGSGSEANVHGHPEQYRAVCEKFQQTPAQEPAAPEIGGTK